MRLSAFIISHQSAIIEEWIAFATTLTPAATSMSKLQLKDHIEQILEFIALDIESDQSAREQFDKSHGMRDETLLPRESASETHGSLRHADGFDVVQMVSEYRALRASVIKLWTADKIELTVKDVLEITRFNESIDQSLAESVARFMQKMDYSKDLLLGVLGHDIRSPLGAISMLSGLLAKVGPLNAKQNEMVEQVAISAKRITDIVNDLLDLTRARIGSGLPIERQPVVLSEVAEQIVEEMRVQNPDRAIVLEVDGDSRGAWDKMRLGQVFSNLIGNAVQYGSHAFPITVSLKGQAKAVEITVHNRGSVISPSDLAILFSSFTRGEHSEAQVGHATANLGLGLFITKEIIQAHEGTIHVVSNETAGTAFTIQLSRQADVPS